MTKKIRPLVVDDIGLSYPSNRNGNPKIDGDKNEKAIKGSHDSIAGSVTTSLSGQGVALGLNLTASSPSSSPSTSTTTVYGVGIEDLMGFRRIKAAIDLLSRDDDDGEKPCDPPVPPSKPNRRLNAKGDRIVDLIESILAESELLSTFRPRGGSLFVFRKNLPREKPDEDDCIVHVDMLPFGFNHDKMREALEEYGKIEYISMPRHDNAERSLKGFGFVEFQTSEQASNAVAHYRASNLGAQLELMKKKRWLELKHSYLELQKQQGGGPSRGIGSTGNSTQGKSYTTGGKRQRAPIVQEDPLLGTVVSLVGLPENMTKPKLRDMCAVVDGGVKFLEYRNGDPAARIRLASRDGARALVEAVEKGPFCDFESTDLRLHAVILEGKAEARFLAKAYSAEKPSSSVQAEGPLAVAEVDRIATKRSRKSKAKSKPNSSHVYFD